MGGLILSRRWHTTETSIWDPTSHTHFLLIFSSILSFFLLKPSLLSDFTSSLNWTQIALSSFVRKREQSNVKRPHHTKEWMEEVLFLHIKTWGRKCPFLYINLHEKCHFLFRKVKRNLFQHPKILQIFCVPIFITRKKFTENLLSLFNTCCMVVLNIWFMGGKRGNIYWSRNLHSHTLENFKGNNSIVLQN